MKRLFLVVLIIPFIFNSCEEDVDNQNDDLNPTNSILGTWKIESHTNTEYMGYIDPVTNSEIITDTEFRFPLVREPEQTSAEVGTDEFDNAYSYYSTTSTKAVGPINSIKLVSPGGFYKRLPIISDIASYRQIEKINITDGGTEYAPGVYYDVGINGDGEGASGDGSCAVFAEGGLDQVTGILVVRANRVVVGLNDAVVVDGDVSVKHDSISGLFVNCKLNAVTDAGFDVVVVPAAGSRPVFAVNRLI